MIQLIDVSKIYQVKRGPSVVALNHVNVTFGEKGLVFILGKSGSGKSTLLNVIGGLDRIDSGDIVIMGKSSKDFTQAEFDSYRNTYLGFIFQEYNILPDFTIGQNIALALQLQGQKGTDQEVDSILDQVDLHGLRDRKPNELSGGQKQRVAIARALIKKPQIIMADEPTGALDSKTGQDIFNTLKKLAKDHLVICVSHDRDFAESFGDRVIELKDGGIVSDITKTYVETEQVEEGVNILSPRLLSFEKGHVLTEEDIALLNRYLAQADHEMLVSSDDAINTGVKTSAKIDTSGKKGTFNATTEESVGAKTYQASEFKLKKSRLPFARSLKIAFKSLKSKPFRLVVTSILIITSLTMFGISATMAGYSPKVAFEGVYQNYEVSAVGLYREKYVKSGTNPDQYSRMAAGFSLKDIPDLNTETGLSFAVFPKLDKLLGYNQNGSITVGNVYHLSAAQTSDKVFDNYCSMAYYPSNESYFEIDAASLKDVYHSSLTSGRMPTSTSEVLISDYRYEAYQKFGYQFDSTPTETTKLSVDDCATPASFLAKSPQIAIEKESWDGTTSTKALKTYPIVGIVHTDFNFTPYQSLKNEVIDSNESYALARQFKSALLESHGNAIFSLSGFYQNLSAITGFNFTNETPAFSLVVSPLGQDLASIDRWFDFLDKNHLLSYDNHPQVGYIYTVEDWANPDKIPEHSSFFSAYSNFCSFNSMITSMKKVFFWVGFATACFASLLLATFIASSIAYQKRQIGILRAIGARGGDVYGIFLNESLLITLTCALVAEILTGVLDGVLSRSFSGAISFNLPLLQFSIWVFLLVLALAVLTAAIASFLPCLIISKKKPIDSINDK